MFVLDVHDAFSRVVFSTSTRFAVAIPFIAFTIVLVVATGVGPFLKGCILLFGIAMIARFVARIRKRAQA